jgi:ketosteroid isomerase-like protein
MSQENVELARSIFEALNRGDRERAHEFAHPEVVLDATRNVFNPKTYVGIDGLRQWLADTDELW